MILAAVQGLEDALKLRAFEFRTPSHRPHSWRPRRAITFGLKLAIYYMM